MKPSFVYQSHPQSTHKNIIFEFTFNVLHLHQTISKLQHTLMQAGLCYFLAIPVLNVSLYKWMKYRISANTVLISAAEHLLAVISTLSESKNCVPFSLVDQVSLIACLSSRLTIWMGQKHIFVKVLLDVQASGPFFMFGAQVNTRENVLF